MVVIRLAKRPKFA